MREFLICGVLSICALPALALADDIKESKEADPEAIIQKFAAKEAEFSQARNNYTYRQTVRVQELDEAGGERGRYEIVSDIIFFTGRQAHGEGHSRSRLHAKEPATRSRR